MNQNSQSPQKQHTAPLPSENRTFSSGTPGSQGRPEWKVYFDGNFWSSQGQDQAGAELRIGESFQWAGRHWLLPAVYSCGEGLVLDLCMRIEPREIDAFMEKWDLTPENADYDRFTREQQMEIELDNPLHLKFHPELEVNGRKLTLSHSCAVHYLPWLSEKYPDEAAAWGLEAAPAAKHYGLDPAYGWCISRHAFLWEGSRFSQIDSLLLSMEPYPVDIPGPRFTAAPGDTISFIHPADGCQCTLTVRDISQETLDKTRLEELEDPFEFPPHYTVLTYTLSPESENGITVAGCSDGDQPRRKAVSPDSGGSASGGSAAAIGIIGGAVIPVVLSDASVEQQKLHAVCSLPRFEPVKETEWSIIFHEKRFKTGVFHFDVKDCVI